MSFFGTSTPETDEIETKCREALRGAHNLNAMFRTLDRFYDLDVPLSTLSKNIILTSLPRMMRIIGAKKR